MSAPFESSSSSAAAPVVSSPGAIASPAAAPPAAGAAPQTPERRRRQSTGGGNGHAGAAAVRPLASQLSVPVHTAFAGSQALWWPCAGVSGGPVSAAGTPLRTPSSRSGAGEVDPFDASAAAGASGPVRPKVVVLFIPGNPGGVAWYERWLSSIYNNHALRGRIEILAIAHRGHAPLQHGITGAASGGHPYYGPNDSQAQGAARGEGTTLMDQVKLKIAAVDAIRAAYPRQPGKDNVKLLVIGHSIGSWITLEVLKARPDAIDGIHLLFPTVSHIGQTPNAKRLAYLLHPLVPSLLISLPLLILSLLPTFVVIFLLRLWTGQPLPAARASAEWLLTPGAVLNSMRMAREEFRVVNGIAPDTSRAIRRFTQRLEAEARAEHVRPRGGIRAYWSRGDEDGWAPQALRKNVEKELQLVPHELPPHVGSRLSRARSFSVSTARSVLNAPFRLAAESASSTSTRPKPTPQPRRRGWHLRSATASRSFDGSIVIEPPDDFSDDGTTENEKPALVLDSGAGAAAGGGAPSPTVVRASETSAVHRGVHKAESLLSSTVCRIGMPHAFCLNHGIEMAHITAHWIKEDFL